MAIRLLFFLVIMVVSCPAVVSAQMSLNNSDLTYQTGQGTKVLEIDPSTLVKVSGSDLSFLALTDPSLLKDLKKDPGLYFFDRSGRLVAEYIGNDRFDPEMCYAASLSPDGKIIALDNGTWLVRAWVFFDFPGFKPIGPTDESYINYLSDNEKADKNLTWVDGHTVIVTDISTTLVSRPCQADICEPLDVVIHDLANWKSQALAKGDELCDYTFDSLQNQTVLVNKTCVQKLEDWENVENAAALRRRTQERVSLPDSGARLDN